MPRLLIFSDIHNDRQALQRLIDIDADYYFAAGDLVSWARGLDKMAEPMKRRAGRIMYCPEIMSLSGTAPISARSTGSSTSTAELLRSEASISLAWDTRHRHRSLRPASTRKRRWRTRLKNLPRGSRPCLICHAPPLNTDLDRIRTGLHAGSRAVRDFIEKHQPEYFFCGHIHEAEGAVIQMGATRAQNVGKKGFLLEL